MLTFIVLLKQIAGHLKESRKNETTSRDKFSQLQEDFALLKDQQAATKYSLTQSKIELKSKIKVLLQYRMIVIING